MKVNGFSDELDERNIVVRDQINLNSNYIMFRSILQNIAWHIFTSILTDQILFLSSNDLEIPTSFNRDSRTALKNT